MSRGLGQFPETGTYHTGAEAKEVEKGSSPEYKGSGLGVSKSDSKFWSCTYSPRCLCTYTEGQRREMAPASSFVPRGFSP